MFFKGIPLRYAGLDTIWDIDSVQSPSPSANTTPLCNPHCKFKTLSRSCLNLEGGCLSDISLIYSHWTLSIWNSLHRELRWSEVPWMSSCAVHLDRSSPITVAVRSDWIRPAHLNSMRGAMGLAVAWWVRYHWGGWVEPKCTMGWKPLAGTRRATPQASLPIWGGVRVAPECCQLPFLNVHFLHSGLSVSLCPNFIWDINGADDGKERTSSLQHVEGFSLLQLHTVIKNIQGTHIRGYTHRQIDTHTHSSLFMWIFSFPWLKTVPFNSIFNSLQSRHITTRALTGKQHSWAHPAW